MSDHRFASLKGEARRWVDEYDFETPDPRGPEEVDHERRGIARPRRSIARLGDLPGWDRLR